MRRTAAKLKEHWREIPGYEGLYEASSLGRVRSLGRWANSKLGSQQWRPGRVLKLLPNSNEYLCVNFICAAGHRKRRYVHQLVMEAFVGPCPEGMEVCHKDGKRTHNQRRNLRYGTRKSNNADRDRHGTTARGSSHGCAKLDEKDVVKIRDEYARGKTSTTHLAKKYGVTSSLISDILNQKSWKHVGGARCSKVLKSRRTESKLSPAKVRKIRKQYKSGKWLQKELAQEFGVSPSTVNDVVNHRRWKDV